MLRSRGGLGRYSRIRYRHKTKDFLNWNRKLLSYSKTCSVSIQNEWKPTKSAFLIHPSRSTLLLTHTSSDSWWRELDVPAGWWNWRNSYSSLGSRMIAEWMPHEYSVCHTYLYCHVKDVEIPAHVPSRWYIRGLSYLYARHATIMWWQTSSCRLTNDFSLPTGERRMVRSHTSITCISVLVDKTDKCLLRWWNFNANVDKISTVQLNRESTNKLVDHHI